MRAQQWEPFQHIRVQHPTHSWPWGSGSVGSRRHGNSQALIFTFSTPSPTLCWGNQLEMMVHGKREGGKAAAGTGTALCKQGEGPAPGSADPPETALHCWTELTACMCLTPSTIPPGSKTPSASRTSSKNSLNVHNRLNVFHPETDTCYSLRKQ